MIGRGPELQALARALGVPGATVQVLGPAGIGKSTVARAAVDGLHAGWIPLEPVGTGPSDGSVDLDATVARALGVPVNPAALAAACQDLDVLVLDGAEALSERLPPWIDGVHAGAPGLRILITTQRRIARATAVELGPLPLPEAERLFRDRAAAWGQDLDLDGEQDALRELVRRLQGWPLAVEIAASRVRLYSCAELLEEGPLALVDPSRGRHRSLEIALQGAWDGLSSGDRAALSAVAQFRSSFDRRGFREVGGTGVDALERLLDASLVRWTSEDARRAYHLLAPVRAFALARLDDPGARERYAEAVLGRAHRAAADELTSNAPSCTAELTTLAADLEGLLAGPPSIAARAALALGVLAKARGPLAPVLGWLSAVPRDALDPALREELDLLQADFHVRTGSPDAAFPLLDGLAETPHTRRMRGQALLGAHRIPEAIGVLEHAARLADEAGDRHESVNARYALGVAHLRQGDFQGALDRFQHGLRQVVQLDRPDQEGLFLKFSALAERELGVTHEVRVQRLERAVALHRRTGASRLEVMARTMLTLALDDAGDPDVDARIDESLALARRSGETASADQMLTVRAMRALDRQDLPFVLEYAASMRATSTDPWVLAWVDGLSGIALQHLGETPSAVGDLDRAVIGLEALGLAGDADLFRTVRALVRREPPPALTRPSPPHGTHGICHRLAELSAAGQAVPDGLAAACATRIESRLLLGLVRQGTGVHVASDGSWFRSATGDRVDLSRKRVLRRVLAALAPGEPLTQDALLRQAWPGEKTAGDSGRARVHVAVAELRKLGLRDALVTATHGDLSAYRLRARVVDP